MNQRSERPDPDALLRRIDAERERERRAKLKVFFGFAPGVGKTYAMLESARRLRASGVDVVVGYVETHGRRETAAMLEGLDVLPRRVVPHRGVQLEEFDLESALARRPRVLLLDELPHTNAPGSRHTKRWQDALDLLDAGIEVHTTLNVQHVESLNDVVAQVSSIRVRETVPDAILDRADEIELCDLPLDELLARLREGKVYLGEQGARAAQNFFRRGNLLALRELALRRTADRVDVDVQAYREEHAIQSTWAAAERILVCVGPSPGSARLVRAARRIAAGLRAPWVAACVEPSAARPLGGAARARLEENLRLAESLGGEVVRLSGSIVSQALLQYARRHNVTRILLGKPTHPRLRDVIRGSLLDEVVRGSGDIDVLVISGDDSTPREGDGAPHALAGSRALERGRGGFVWTALLVGVATALAALGRAVLEPTDMVMLFLLVIMIAAVRYGRGPSILASAMSVAAYDFFFVPPHFTFAVSDGRHLLTFLMMFGAGLFISGLTLRIRRQEQSARGREARTASLYALSRELGSALDAPQAAAVLARQASSVFESGAAVLLPGPGGALKEAARAGEVPDGPAEQGVARWVLEHGRLAGRGTDTLPGARVTCVPLRSGSSVLGVLALAPASVMAPVNAIAERDFLDAFVRQGALAIERAVLAEEAKAAALRARAEEMRSSLLSAVSHDLRTPLAAITGAATALRDETAGIPEAQRSDLIVAICEEAERLERLVANLLDMTRLESGGLRVKREWVPLEESVGAALTRLEPKLAGREVTTDLAPDLPLLSVDPVLLEQVFVNLLENAAKYTPKGSPIEIRARVSQAMPLEAQGASAPGARAPGGVEDGGNAVHIEVADRGPGVPAGAEEKVFEKFYRGPHVGIGGVGLGLSICRGILEAHGGSLVAENRSDGGCVFRMTLPIVGQPPSIPPEADAVGALLPALNPMLDVALEPALDDEVEAAR